MSSASAAALAAPRATIFAAILLVLGATACFATMDTATKYITAAVPLLMAVWFRYTFQALLTTAVVLPLRGLRVLRTRHLAWQLARGALLFTSSMLAFVSLRYLPVGEFSAICMMAPLVTTVLAATLLKEQVSALRWSLVAGGFIGTLMIMQPGGTSVGWAGLLPLALVGCNSAFQVLTSRLARTEDPVTMHLYTGWTGALAATVLLPLAWSSLPDPRLWAILVLMGVVATVGHFLLILAFYRAPAATLTPYLYAQIAFGMVGGVLVFGHVPDPLSLLGIALIAFCGAAGAWLTLREQRASQSGA